MTTAADDLPDDPRLFQAVQEYLADLEAGRRPSRAELTRRYPDLAAPLARCLDGLELVHRAVHDEPTVDAAPAVARAEAMPTSPLGDFQILREIGRGGMGIVYEAVQLSLGRRVALKVLPFAATFDAKHLQRFQNEAHAAAQLHHTNIVPVYFVGCERGTHFYAMQLIEGQSLAEVIRQLRQRVGRPDESSAATSPSEPRAPAPARETISELSAILSTQRAHRPKEYIRAAARFMVQAAEALEHAHQFGIVHRDIKPANLLVDVHGRLWITDFGLAQFHADASLTRTGDIVGTLRYMSPEQASGRRAQIDHRADIYSLGATLYELVTLEHIFPGESRVELLHQIHHDEPRAPRALEKSVPVELETIILKAVSKHPGDRYASAQEFANDLQRFLADEPILAKRPSLIERMRKWSRRHPSVVAAGVLLLFVCIAGLLVNNWLIAREQAKTTAALTSEKQRASEARRAVDLLVEVSEEELADLPYLQGVRKRLLMTALNYYQDFIESQGAHAEAQTELAAGKARVRRILDELATLEGANLLYMAMDDAVQKDLQVSPFQFDRLAALRDESWDQYLVHFRDQGKQSAEARRQMFYELAKTRESALAEILQPEQLRRLRQIELQLQGTRAFHEAFVIQELKLTAEQRRKIREFKEDTLAALRVEWPGIGPFDGPPKDMSPVPPEDRGPFGKGGGPGKSGVSKGGPGKGMAFGKAPFDRRPFGPGGPDDFERRGIHEKLQKVEMERIAALLTDEQKNRWQELTGSPFRGKLRPPPGGRGPKGPPLGPGN